MANMASLWSKNGLTALEAWNGLLLTMTRIIVMGTIFYDLTRLPFPPPSFESRNNAFLYPLDGRHWVHVLVANTLLCFQQEPTYHK